jgi:hypothetical protein
MSRPLLSLSDDELNHIMAAAAPIPVDRRDAFLKQVVSSLAACKETGPDVVHRIAAATQKQFL